MLDCSVSQRRRLLPIRAEQNEFIEMEHDDFTRALKALLSMGLDARNFVNWDMLILYRFHKFFCASQRVDR